MTSKNNNANVVLWQKEGGMLEKDVFSKKLGEFIRNERKNNNISQELLAEKADISTKFLRSIENGKSTCSIFVMTK